MIFTPKRWARVALCAVMATALAGCGLPRSGPSKSEIYQSSVQRQGDAFVIEVDDQIARITELDPGLAFGSDFAAAGMLGSDTIQPGDTLGLTIWENVDEGLLVAGGAGAALVDSFRSRMGSSRSRRRTPRCWSSGWPATAPPCR